MKRIGLFLILIIIMGNLPIALGQTENYIQVDKVSKIRFYKGSTGYDTLLKPDGTPFIYSQRYTVEYLSGKTWKQIGVPYEVKETQNTVTRYYSDYLSTSIRVIYDKTTGKTNIEIESGETREYRIVWELDGITNTQYQLNQHGANFTGPIDWVYMDWLDTIGIDSTPTITDSANGKKLTVTFNIGTVEKGATYTLDPSIIDSYSEANQSSQLNLQRPHPSTTTRNSAIGQSFTTDGRVNITQAKFYLKKSGNPTGTAYAKLYAHNGVYGTSSTPTGAALATSNGFDVSTLTTAYQLITFTFPTPYEASPATYYCISFENPAAGTIDDSNYIIVGVDNTPAHSGNEYRYYNSAYTADAGAIDTIFYIYGETVLKSINISADVIFNKDNWAWFNTTVYDNMGVAHLSTVTVQFNTTSDVNNFTLRWTQAGDTFTEVSDPDGICTLNLGVSDTLNATTVLLSFNITMTGGQSGYVDAEVTVLSDDADTLSKTYLNAFTFSYFNWDSLVYDFINSAFDMFGITGFMTSFTTYITGVVTYFNTSLTNIIELIVLQFKIVTNSITWILRWLTRFVDRIVSMFSIIIQILNGTYPGIGTLVNFWNLIELSSWVDVIVLIGIYMWAESIQRRGQTQGEIQVILGDIMTVVNILSWFMGMFNTVINIVIDGVFRLFSAIT